MFGLTNLFSNDVMKNAALGTLKKSMLQGGVGTVIVRLKTLPDGTYDLDFEMRQASEGPLVAIPAADLDLYRQTYIAHHKIEPNGNNTDNNTAEALADGQ